MFGAFTPRSEERPPPAGCAMSAWVSWGCTGGIERIGGSERACRCCSMVMAGVSVSFKWKFSSFRVTGWLFIFHLTGSLWAILQRREGLPLQKVSPLMLPSSSPMVGAIFMAGTRACRNPIWGWFSSTCVSCFWWNFRFLLVTAAAMKLWSPFFSTWPFSAAGAPFSLCWFVAACAIVFMTSCSTWLGVVFIISCSTCWLSAPGVLRGCVLCDVAISIDACRDIDLLSNLRSNLMTNNPNYPKILLLLANCFEVLKPAPNTKLLQWSQAELTLLQVIPNRQLQQIRIPHSNCW